MAENFDAEAEIQKVVERKAQERANKEIANITKATNFSTQVDEAKLEIIKNASANDDKFIQELTNELKDAVKKSAQLEKEKQELEVKNIELEKNYIKTKNDLETNKQKEDKWANKQKAREFHYNGVKDIMKFVHINHPMNPFLMYLVTFLIMPVYLVWTLVICPLGSLIAGTNDNNRPKLVKGAIYTLLLIALTIAVIFGAYGVMHYWFKWF